ncbi:MAG: hypothetical protein ACTHOH_18245 [Lysobacteraceae bacterium]
MTPFARCLPLVLAACLSVAGLPVESRAASVTVHVWADARGVRSYQDTPCAVAQRNVAIREFAVIAPDAAAFARSRAIEAEMDRRHRGSGDRVRIVRTATPKRAPDPCRVAKDRRDSELKRVGLKRTFDQLSRLDGDVWDACHGF